MAGDPREEGAQGESPIERELRTQTQLHLLALHQARLEEMALIVHRATCPVLACSHTYADVDPLDVQRAQYVLNATDESS